jgi:pilus assembly protein Flp/PilA
MEDIKQIETMELVEEEKGASMLEYALLAALIAVVAIAAVTFLGQQASQTFSEVGTHLGGAA